MAIRDYRPKTTAPAAAPAPQVSLAVAGDTSGAQAIGNAIFDVGAKLERAKQETELSDARVRLTEGLGELNRELTQDTDYATMRERYDARLKDLSADVMGRVSTPGLKRRMTEDMARARVAAEANVFDREWTLRSSHGRANVSRLLRDTASQIPNAGSEEAQGLLYNQALEAIEGALEAGIIDAEQAEASRVQLDTDVSTALVMRDLNTDPGATAAALTHEGAYGLEEIDRQRYLAQARRQAEQQTNAATRELESRVNAARGLLVRGQKPDEEELAALREDVQGTEHAAELEASIEASQALGSFAQATPAERAAYLEEVRGRGIAIDDATLGVAHIATLEAIDADRTRAETAELKAVGDQVEAAVIALGDGRDVADIDAVRAAAKGTPFEDDLDLAERRAGFVRDYASASVAEQQQLLAQARKDGVLTGNRTHDEAFLDSLETINRSAEAAVKQDPVQFAIDNGVTGAEPLDLGDQASVRRRMAVVEELTQSYGAEPMIFTTAERKALKKQLDEGEPEDQLALVVSMIDGFGPASRAAFSELDGIDPVIRHAGNLVLETGDDEVAGIILQGRKAMRAGDEASLAGLDQIETWGETIAGALGPVRREETIEAAKAYYAARAPGRVDPMKPNQQTALLAESVQRVTGATIIRGTQYGGIQEVNGRHVRLPGALDRRAAEKLVNEAGLELWQGASLSGNPPHEGDTPMKPDDAVLQWVEGSIYRVGVQSRRGEVEWYQDPATDNGFYYVDLDRLAAGYLQAQKDAQ